MKVSAKEFKAFQRMRKEWPSENEAYNLQTFGITKARFYEIHKIAADQVGPSFVGSITLREINHA